MDAIEGVLLQSATLHHPFGVFFVQPLEADVPDHDPLYGFVGMLPLGAIISRHTDFLLQFHQGIFLTLGCLESAVDERVDRCAAEAGCRISLYVHLDEHVGLLQVLEVVVLTHEVDELAQDGPGIVQLVGRFQLALHIHADDDVGPHLLGDVHGIVVHHATVHQHHAVQTDGGKYARYGHTGTHGGREHSIVEYIFLTLYQVLGYTGKGDG